MKLRLPLPLLDVSTGAVDVRLGRRKASDAAGPFLIIARACGLALDTALRSTAGEPHLWETHGLPQQLWALKPTGVAGQVYIVSVANGLVLDSGPDSADPALWMWDQHGKPWQHWQLEKTPDGVGCLIQAPHSGRYLAAHEKTVHEWKPWFEDRDPTSLAQQWLLTQPHSYTAK